MKKKTCSLLSPVPRIEGEGWECGYALRKGNLFLIFLRGGSFSGGILLVRQIKWVTNIEQSQFDIGSISTVGCRTKRHTRPADCRTLCLMLAQRDLWESVVLAYHGKENRTRAEDSWVNPRPATPSLYDSGEVTS